MYPWEDGFFTTCVGLVANDGRESIVWLEHNEVKPTVGGIAFIQTMVDWADLIVGHNLKYDIVALMSHGVDFSNAKIWDTLVAEYLLSGHDVGRRSFKLDDVAEFHKIKGKDGADEMRMYWDNGRQTNEIPKHVIEKYQIQDCKVPLALYEKQRGLAENSGMLRVIELQCEWTLCLCDMEFHGLGFDYELAERIVEEYKAKAEIEEQKIREALNEPHLNLSSNIQRSAVIYGGVLKTEHYEWVIQELKVRPESYYSERKIKEQHEIKGLGFPLPKNPKARNQNGYYKVDHDTIAELPARNAKQREYKRILLEFAKYTKVHQTLLGKSYNTGLMRKVGNDGRVHPSLNQTVSRTGRLTSNNPNGQNMFTIIKETIKPINDYIGQVDLSQVEWRAAGELSGDEVIIHEVNSGIDQHVETTTKLMMLPFKDKSDPESKKNRNHAKVFNFRMIYGGSEWGFHLDINMPNFGLKKWKSIIVKFFKKYVGLKRWHEDNIRFVFENGYLKIPTGRWFKMYKTIEIEGELTYRINQIKNYPIQGIAGGDILPLCAVIIRRGMNQMKMKSKMILTVHDSLVFDIVKGEEDKLKDLCLRTTNSLREYIQAYYKIPWRTYLEGEFEIGPNYKDQKEVKLHQSCKEVLNG